MNRIIKFRAWDGENMTYDWFALERTTVDTLIPFQRSTMAKEVMQFIGLHDKNGKEIYEGDVVHIGGLGYGKVIFLAGTFKVRISTINYPLESLNQEFVEIEVIGNIYENKDLLT